MFADDTSLFDTSENMYDSIPRLASDLSFISSWAKKWKIKINASKTEGLIINKKANPSHYVIPKIQLNDCQVNFVVEHKHVGIWLNKKLDWKTHISNLASSCFLGTFIQHFYVFSMNLYWKGQICSVC